MQFLLSPQIPIYQAHGPVSVRLWNTAPVRPVCFCHSQDISFRGPKLAQYWMTSAASTQYWASAKHYSPVACHSAFAIVFARYHPPSISCRAYHWKTADATGWPGLQGGYCIYLWFREIDQVSKYFRRSRVRTTLCFFQRHQMFLPRSLVKIEYCGEPPWSRDSMLDLRPPGLEFRILCLEGSVISFISASSRGSPGPV